MKKLAILGSTGSIGTQAMEIIGENRDKYEVAALTCGRNTELLKKQILLHKDTLEVVVCEQEEDAKALQNDLKAGHIGLSGKKIEVLHGPKGLEHAAGGTSCHMVLNALTGMRGLAPTLKAIEASKDIALANKEALVAGGWLVLDAAAKRGVNLLPVDSEHSAIFQCLQGIGNRQAEKIFLTASGGPFRGSTLKELENVTVEQALQHPNWTMGSKITIDSATMMNKGLEVIEAYWLFGTDPKDIQVVVHPQSIIHSMVEFKDHAVLAQLGQPDMKLPIGYAFSYPDRMAGNYPSVDFFTVGQLDFYPPDMETFKCLKLAYQAILEGGSSPIVLNAANEILVSLFLQKRIKFTDIQNTIEMMLESHVSKGQPGLEEILSIDRETRERVLKWF